MLVYGQADLTAAYNYSELLAPIFGPFRPTGRQKAAARWKHFISKCSGTFLEEGII